MKSKVFFRADGNSIIGLGHITRSLALAQTIQNDFECTFLIQEPSLPIKTQIEEANFPLVSLPLSNEYLLEAERIVTQLDKGSILVLDGYHFTTSYQAICKAGGIKLVCIDDTHNQHFVADAIINHAGGVNEKEYSCEKYTKLYLGTDYALLRKPFIKAATVPKVVEEIKNVFVCFGGADPQNLTLQSLQACLKSSSFEKINVVIGSAYQFISSLPLEDQRVQIFQNLDAEQMTALMGKCQLAIAPASSIACEICSVGMLFLTGYYVENQKNIYQFLIEKGLALPLNDFAGLSSLEIDTQQWEQEQLDKQREYFHGQSLKYLPLLFTELTVSLRLATLDDARLYFDWANDPSVRENSLNSQPILWEQHIQWFTQKIEEGKSIFLVFLYDDEPFGQLRLDPKEGYYLINYSIDKRYRGKKLGEIIVKNAMNYAKLERLATKFVGFVKRNNPASLKIFQKLNFKQEFEGTDLMKFTFDYSHEN